MNSRQHTFPLYALGRVIAMLLLRLFFRVRVRGREHVPLTGGVIVVANHIAYFDPPVLGIALPRPIGYLAQIELFRTRLSRWFFQQLRCVPINRAKPDRASIREAIRRLREGWCLGIFPEGGIRRGENSVLGGQPTLRAGAGALALLAGVPLVPALIEGTRQGYEWKKLLLLRRPIVHVTFGEPFHLPPGHSREKATAQIRDRLLALARAVNAEAR